MLKTSLMAFCLAMPLGATAATVTINPAFAPAPLITADAKPKTITFKAADNSVIKAEYWAPKGSSRAPAALLIHDAGADQSQMKALAERLQKSGYAVLAPDLRGHGKTLVKPENDWAKLEDDQARAKAWAFTTRDVEASARWMRTQKGIHSSNLNLFGFGAGAALAVHQGGKDENTRSVTLISPRREMLGFNLSKDLLDLEGVPTYLISTREGRDEVEAMSKTANDRVGESYITVINLKAKKVCDALGDRKLGSSITKPLKAIAFPTRGSR